MKSHKTLFKPNNICIAIGILFVLIVYSNTFFSPFVFDDVTAITNNPTIRITEISNASYNRLAGNQQFQERPIGIFFFAMNYYFGGLNPFGYHLVNILIHTITGILLYFVVLNTLYLTRDIISDQPKVKLISGFAALVWLLHPVELYSVTYIVQRENQISVMFYLVALLLYIYGRNAYNLKSKFDKKSCLLFAFSFCSAFLAFLSKQIAVTIPVVIFLYEFFFYQNGDFNWIKKSRVWILLMVLALLGTVYFNFGAEALQKIAWVTDSHGKEFTTLQRVMTEWRIVVFYFSLLIFPLPARLTFDYDFPLSYSLFDPITTLLSLLFIVGCLGFAVYMMKRNRLVSFCILWFFINLALESTVIGLDLIYLHRLYLPSTMIALLFVVCMAKLLPKQKQLLGIMVPILIILGVFTLYTNSLWNDEVTLFKDNAEKCPDSFRVQNNLGIAYYKHKRPEKALEHYFKALEIKCKLRDQKLYRVYINIGDSYLAMRKFDDAEEYYLKSLNRVESSRAYSNLGVIYARKNKVDKAIEYFKKAIERKPDDRLAHNNLGMALASQQKYEEAISHYKAAVYIDPRFAKAYNNMGIAYGSLRQLELAEYYFRKALQVKPGYMEAKANLAKIRK